MMMSMRGTTSDGQNRAPGLHYLNNHDLFRFICLLIMYSDWSQSAFFIGEIHHRIRVKEIRRLSSGCSMIGPAQFLRATFNV
jgi:hypothetical protein